MKQKRLQKSAGHAPPLEVVLDVVGQCRISDVRWRFVRGVVQCAHARDDALQTINLVLPVAATKKKKKKKKKKKEKKIDLDIRT